ncbi:MAG: PIN domain-containing protein [Thermomicrobiales bacterium]
MVGTTRARRGNAPPPTLVTAEVAGAIARLSGNSEAGHQAAARLRSTYGVELFDLDDEREANGAQLAANLRLRGADAIYVAIAHEVGAPLATWDREQRERASVLIHAFEPEVPRSSFED